MAKAKAAERLQRERERTGTVRPRAITGAISLVWGLISPGEVTGGRGGRKGLWSSVNADWRSYPER